MNKKIALMDAPKTYFFLWKQHMMGRRIALARYGDGEFFIMRGKKSVIATHIVTDQLSKLLSESIKKKGQLICMPTSMAKSDKEGSKNVRSAAARHFIKLSGHKRFGTGNWRILDVQFDFNLLTEFFIGKTLVVTGNHAECKKAFDMNKIKIDVLEGRKNNAFADYNILKKKLVRQAKRYNNIIFALGPTSNILIADLLGVCKANLIDIGGFFGFVINPYSPNEMLIKQWTGIPKRSNKEIPRRISKIFFKKLKDKIKLYGEN